MNHIQACCRALLVVSMLAVLPVAVVADESFVEAALADEAFADEAIADEAFTDDSPADQPADVASILSAHAIVTGRYLQQQHLTGLGQQVSATGEFVLIRDQALLWRPLQPAAPEQLFKKNSRGAQAAQRVMSRLLLDVFSADVLSNRQFRHEVHGHSQAWQMTLLPQRRAMQRHLREIHLTGGDFVESALIKFSDSRTTEIIFSDQASHAALPERFCPSLAEVMQDQTEVACEPP